MKTIEKFNTSNLSSFKLASLLVLSLLVLASCKKPNDDEPELQSAVNIVNATIGMPKIAFYINKTLVQGEPLNYTDETGYFITFPGTRDFDVVAENITDAILKTNFNFKQNTYHSVFITGESTSITALFTEDDLTNPPQGKAKIRFVHVSPDGGSLVIAVKNGAVLFPEQTFKTASPFITLDPGVYDLQLKTATGNVITERNVTVAAGTIYTVWAKGMKAGTANSPLGLQFRAIN